MGPRQLGGTAAYVITHGISMEPKYHEGDLVLLKQAGSYSAGDIVGYDSPSIRQTVLHRIHRFEGETFFTKGDNNGWVDTDPLQDADVIGKEWLHVPGAGTWLLRARSPIVASILLSLVGLSFMLGKTQKRRRSRKGNQVHVPRIALGSFSEQQKMILGGAAATALVFLLFSAASFRQPLVSAVSADAAYEHIGNFAYTSDVKINPVYPTGKVEPGQPVFLKLVDELDVTFDYELSSEADASLAGQAVMFARVSGATGWKKAFPISPSRPFKGKSVALQGTLNFDEIRELSRQVQSITGLAETGQTVELLPRINVDGRVAGEQVTEQFAPALSFQMDPYQLKLLSAGGAAATGTEQDPSQDLRKTQPGEVSVSDVRSNALKLLGLSVGIDSARRISLLGLLASLGALAFLFMRFSNPEHADEPSKIAAQYGEWLIPVESMDSQAQHKTVQVKSMEALVRLAELYERMILHEESERGNSYFVEEEGVMYYYRPVTETKTPPAQLPGQGGPRFGGRKMREERRKDEVERLRKELTQIEAEVLREKAGPTEEA